MFEGLTWKISCQIVSSVYFCLFIIKELRIIIKSAVFKWHLNNGPFGNRTTFDHLHVRLVQHSDPHCMRNKGLWLNSLNKRVSTKICLWGIRGGGTNFVLCPRCIFIKVRPCSNVLRQADPWVVWYLNHYLNTGQYLNGTWIPGHPLNIRFSNNGHILVHC